MLFHLWLSRTAKVLHHHNMAPKNISMQNCVGPQESVLHHYWSSGTMFCFGPQELCSPLTLVLKNIVLHFYWSSGRCSASLLVLRNNVLHHYWSSGKCSASLLVHGNSVLHQLWPLETVFCIIFGPQEQCSASFLVLRNSFLHHQMSAASPLFIGIIC